MKKKINEKKRLTLSKKKLNVSNSWLAQHGPRKDQIINILM